jgi:hypothetical protein
VVFEDHFVPDDHVFGKVDLAWTQATSELAYERSGPERFLETSYVLFELVRVKLVALLPLARDVFQRSERS